MAQEIGVAYVTLLPAGKGFGKAVEGQVDEAVNASEKKTSGFFSKLGKGVKTVALGIAGVATGVAALAVGGGISRALNIEDAQAKLKGLGHDTQSVELIMSNALASVKGTAFGLDAAATTAATAIAAGIKPGKELERYLRLTADAATIAGISLDEMGSILNKTTAKGKVQLEELNQLQERNIPIIQWLADEYGVTAEAMYEMVSRGEVDVARFRKALEDNLGGAALSVGDTTRGAFANMMTSISRFGEVLVGDGLGAAKTFFNELTIVFDGLSARIGPWVDKIQEKLGGMFKIDGMGEDLLDRLDELFTKIANGPIPQLLNALQPLLPALEETVELIGPALGDALTQLAEALLPVLPQIVDELVPAIVELAPQFADLLTEILPLLPTLVELAVEVLPVLVDVLDKLLPLITDLTDTTVESVEAFTDLFNVLSGDKSLEEWNATLAEGSGLYAGFARDVQSAGWDIGITLAKVQEGFETIRDAITRVMGEVSDSVRAKWDEVAGSFALGVTRAVGFVMSLPSSIIGAVAGAGSWLVQTGRDMIQGLINGVSSMVSQAVAAVKNVGGQMLDGVKSFLGIHSPSRVFRDQVGKMVGLGLLEGVSDRAISRRIDAEVNHLVPIPDGVSFAGASVVQNNTFNAAETDDRLLMARAGRYLKEALV